MPDDQPRLGAGLLFGLAVVFLVGEVFASAAALGADSDVSVMIATVAHALPSVVGATLVAGAAAGLWVCTRSRFAGSVPPSVRRRLALGAITGGVVGVVVGGGILLTFGASGGVGVLAATLVAAGVLGGLAAAAPPPVLAAGLAAVLACLVLAIVISIFQFPLASALGGGTDIQALTGGALLLSVIEAVLQGVLAAVVAYRLLRARGGGRAWPWYLLAGSGYGVFGLATIVVSRIGGSGLYHLVRGFSADDAAVLDFILQASLRAALITGFVGGIGAMIAIGRTLTRTTS